MQNSSLNLNDERLESHASAEEYEYIISVLLGPLRSEDRFVRWPYHITVVPWFEIEDSAIAVAIMNKVAAMLPAFSADYEGLSMFGPQQNVPVTTLDSSCLQELHSFLATDLENEGAYFVAPHYMFGGYHPHITNIQGNSLPSGGSVPVKKLWLIKAKIGEPRKTRLKKVVAEVELHE